MPGNVALFAVCFCEVLSIVPFVALCGCYSVAHKCMYHVGQKTAPNYLSNDFVNLDLFW